MIRDFIAGARFATRGFGLIRRPGVRRYVVIPLLINIVLFAGVIWYGASQFEGFLDWLLPAWLDWARWLLWPLFAAATLVAVFFTFTLIANLIGAPFNGLLAEKLEAELTGEPPPKNGGIKAVFADAGGAIIGELRKLAYMLGWGLALVLLLLIPGLNLLAPALWLIFGAWLLALEYMDYPMGNHRIGFAEQRERMRQNRSLALGFGGVITLITFVPGLNFFAMPVGVAGATALWVERLHPLEITARQ